ncbi:polysaccharide deacetylase family protein [Halomonas sp. ATCH28]|uniref:Polysaccharide deacetylase family protein n=1 Tax=Halomonas gemina TaxID=2945105 RepID=A0ABT0SXK5_9GAMM|nr:polysaccharide deacetylase family protein [Halomonas gemina]MCL7939348.1 polysaccharide deacetylase family protein [Halomonas gemina]
MTALISIHDVMPETLDHVGRLIRRLKDNGHCAITLLVVPGRNWSADDIRRLTEWSDDGIELAAHGWHHRAAAIRGIWHRLHAVFLSRDAAEHLALDADAIEALMRDSAAWFIRQGLPTPTTYVPPAWALGPLPRDRWSSLPFRRIEVTRGIIDIASGRLYSLPLVGFEADTRYRAAFLRRWNRFQVWQARRRNRPLRVGIHPHDGELKLADDLAAFIKHGWKSRRMDDGAWQESA